MTYHDNDVTFSVTSNNLVSGSFTVNSFSVTGGQDPDNKIHAGLVVNCKGDGKFTFSVGRKGSSDVANWFSKNIPADRTTFNHDPGDLNFAMIGTLVLNFANGITCTFYNVAIAQGHSGASNNWWYGGQQAFYNGGNTVICGASSNQQNNIPLIQFQRGGNDVSTVSVTPKTF
ncbi:hypothetical protein [Chryseobacterium sp. FH2]|uniref:hypothetical protein n=1 Tax=Chryseobacterium sp. FH2 TaxID=1674291 RepID=UPI000A4EFC86|nr:hypothetical protein [Chryseobacterium sp. FH2]